MARHGPVPVPDNVRQLRGNPGKRAPKRRLKLPPSAPPMPSWLPREAKAEWRRVVPGLDRMGVLATVDRAVLTTYCVAWSRFVDAEREIRRDGLMSSRSDRPAKHPLWQVWREAAVQVRDLAKELYLTPTARLRSELPQGAGSQVAERDEADGILD